MKKHSLRYKIFYGVNWFVLIAFCIMCLYPFINTLAIALNESKDTMMGGITLFPRKFTLENFAFILKQEYIKFAFMVTVSRVVLVTVLSVLVLFAAAYALSKKELPGRNWMISFLMMTMFITPGLIPTYILYGQLKLLNNYLVYILPCLFSFYNIVVIKSNLSTIPESVFESAHMDGASELTVLLKIVIPLSMPVLATISLWTAVGIWGDWTTTLYFASSNQDLYTLQYYIKLFTEQARVIREMVQQGKLLNGSAISSTALQAAQVMITTIPIVCVYPFLQKYFVKGVITGSVKE